METKINRQVSKETIQCLADNTNPLDFIFCKVDGQSNFFDFEINKPYYVFDFTKQWDWLVCNQIFPNFFKGKMMFDYEHEEGTLYIVLEIKIVKSHFIITEAFFCEKTMSFKPVKPNGNKQSL